MKKLERNTIAKKLLAILLVIATILPYFPMSVFADNESNAGNSSIQFDAKWDSLREVEVGTTNDTFGSNYTFTLNGSSTGFQNVQLLLETDNAAGANDTVTVRGITGATAQTSEGTGFAVINFGNINQGQEIGGQVSVKFVNSEQVTRKLTITLTGTYTDSTDGTTKSINMKKELTATVTPATVTTPYLADMTWQDYYYNGMTRYKTPSLVPDKTQISGNFGQNIGFYTNNFEATYPIKVYSYEKTQELKLDVTINRYTDNVSKLSDGYTIDWNGLDTDLGTPTVTTNDDGSKTYTFIKGTDNGSYNGATAFSLNKTYDIKITYDTPNTDPRNSNAEFRTFVSFESDLNTVGYKLEKQYNQNETAERITTNRKLTDTRGINLYSYTPGENAWISVNASSSKIGSYSKITSSVRDNLKNGQTVNVNADIYIRFIDGVKEQNETGYINLSQPKLTYIGDDGRIKTLMLNANQMKIKTVSKSDTNRYDSEFVYDSTATPFDSTYTASDNVNEFTIKLNNFVSEAKPVANYYLDYDLNLSDSGLSATEIENIQSLSINFTTSNSAFIQGEDSFILNKEVIMSTNRYSYMEMELEGDFDTTSEKLNKAEEKTIKLKMFKNTDVMYDTETSRNYVVNENPIFYVEFPNSGSKYEYDIDPDDITITSSSNIQLDEENIDLVTIEGSDYLVIPCIGTYESYKDREVDISIKFTRTLLDASSAKTYIHTYMLTDNENYFRESRNVNEFTKASGEESDVAYLATGSFNVVGINRLEAITKIYDEVKGKDYQPNPSDGIDNDDTEKEMPLIVESNKKVTFISQLKSQNETIKKATILSRLPVQNNTFIENTNNQLIENDFELPQDFYTNHANKINGNAQGSAVTQTSLQNLNIIGVYRIKNGSENTLDQSKYKIYYTTEANATFDSTSFVEYVPGGTNTDFADAKNIKVVITDPTETLQSGESYVFKYEMTMPDAPGMVGAETAVQYTKSDNSTNTLYSPAAYVINGDESATINVQKTFENYPAGVIPEAYGVNSLAGITFKLQYYNKTTKQREFLKDSSNNDVTAVTDATGKATFASVPAGRYFLYEVTEFANYSGIGNVNIINAGLGETINYTADNKVKRGNITINKTWQGANETQGPVTFRISRVNAENETLSFTPMTITTDDNDQAFVRNVPYGTYSITEQEGQVGWVAEEANKQVTLNAEEKTVEYKNVPGKATLQIVKTVPKSETVDGLSFKVVGRSSMKKQDTLNIDVNSVITFKIGANDNPANVTIEKSENDTKATITITDLYLGYYTVEEIDIPVIEGTDDVTKYVGVGDNIILSENGGTGVINLVNNHKYAKIVINKTAKLKDGDQYYNISDLSGFQVRVTGHSFYDTTKQVNELLTLDEDGYAEIELEVGKYTVTEVPVDGYTAYYGPVGSRTTTPQEITLKENNETVTQEIYNEHTGVGYVRVEKTLEGVTDPQEVINKGIKFAVVGRNVANEQIGQTIEGTLKGVLIEINQIDTEKNVAYGISGPISVGGEYELQEVESTIPDYYEAYEPTEIQVTTANTQSNPNVVNINNEKSRGNLEMITTTNPEGGPLTGIQYSVTPVKINSDATYTATGTAQIVDGSNDAADASFAKLENIYAGFYAVELVADSIPEGWKGDVKQIVEVPSYNTGYANFEITQKKQARDNKVTIKKVLYDENDEIATNEYIENMQLNTNESFEVKITNVNTREEYYVFTSVANPGVITGLDAGTYTVEEVYKPKYTTLGYNEEVVVPPSIDDGTIEPQVAKQPLENATFTIEEEGTTIKDVTLVIDNKVNKDFGFGGQDSKDNLSKLDVEEQQETFVTKAIIYVTDEENKAISGVKFQLLNSAGQVVTLTNMGSEFEIFDRKLTIKGLPAGVYTLRCTQYPEGYLKPDDKEVVVYSDATQVVRVEVQKNIPRGNITLSTVFYKKNGEPRYVTRSEYKVVDHATGELVKFVRTPSGNYKKSNSPEASPIITLKAGPVELQGLELGDYEVGIVGVKKGYGIIKDEPEYVTVEENVSKNVVTTVVDRTITQIDVGVTSTSYVDVNGDLYIVGYFGDTQYNKFEKINFPENVKIAKYYQASDNLVAIDTNGKAWFFGKENYDKTLSYYPNLENSMYRTIDGKLNIMKCLSDEGTLATAYQEGVRFVDVVKQGESTLLLDNQGRVWGLGKISGDGNSNEIAEIKPIQEFIDNGVRVAKFAKVKQSYGDSGTSNENCYGVIDTSGKLWIWGNASSYLLGTSSYVPVCISDTTDLNNVVIKDAAIGKYFALALDEDGNIWLWGNNSDIQSTIQGGTPQSEPTLLSPANFNGAKIKDIACGYTGSSSVVAVVDEYGKVWTWGKQNYGELGYGAINSNFSIPRPSCISTITANEDTLKDAEVTNIVISPYASTKRVGTDYEYGAHVVALDKNNRLWAWGGSNSSGSAGQSMTPYVHKPQRLYSIYDEHLEYNLRFKKVFGNTSDHHYAIDDEGRLWVWGNNANNELGLNSSNIEVPTIVEIPGNPEIKKVDVTNNNAIILSEDGRVFICGYYGYTGDGQYKQRIAITEITSNFSSDIIDVATTGSSYIALDSAGYVWTWGDDSWGAIGRSSNTGTIYQPLRGDIVKISSDDTNGFAITNAGKVIKWSGTSSPSNLQSSSTFIDMVGDYMLDSNGHVWYYNGTSVLEPVTSSTSHNLNSKYNDSKYKIVEMFKVSNRDSIMLKDSNGDFWYQSSYSDATKLDTGIESIISVSNDLLVDKYGQIWSYDGNTATSIMATTKVENPAYGLKFDHLIANNLLAGKNNKIYNRTDFAEETVTNSLWTDTKDTLRIEGKKMVASYGGSNYNYTNATVFLDENGKLWWYTSSNGYGGTYINKTLTCLNDEGSALHGVNISKIYGYKYNNTTEWYTFFALDDSGNVYSWGANYKGQCGNGSTTHVLSPVKLNITGIKEIKGFSYGSLGSSFAAIANDGSVYVWGENSRGILGNGTTSNVTTPYKINLGEGIKVKDIDLDSINSSNNAFGILLCEDGKVYVSNKTTKQWTYVSDCDGGETIIRVKTSSGGSSNRGIVSGNNKMWFVKNGTVEQRPNECTPQYVLGYDYLVDTKGNWIKYDSIGSSSYTDVDTEKIVAKNGEYLYSIDGKRYKYDSTSGNKAGEWNISEQIKAIYGALTEENVVKFAQLGNKGLVNGKVWIINENSDSLYAYSLNNLPDSPMNGKTIVDFDGTYAIDSEGDLYYYDSSKNKVTCLTRDEYLVTEGALKANHNIVNFVKDNNLYGTKFKDIANDKFAIDENDNVWYFPTSGSAKNISAELEGELNPFYGKEVKKMINESYLVTTDNEIWYVGGNVPQYVMKAMDESYTVIAENFTTVGYEYVIALDSNGKVWTCGANANGLLGNGDYTTNGEPVCINNIADTELYNANVQFTKAYSTGTRVYAIDNSGKVWLWGKVGTTPTVSPTCVTESTTSNYLALHDAYYNDNVGMVDFCTKSLTNSQAESLCMKDSTGELWVLSTNQWNKFASAYRVLEAPEGTKIVDANRVGVLTADGHIYTTYPPAYTASNGRKYAANSIKFKLLSGIENVTALYDGYFTRSSSSPYSYTFETIAETEDGIYEIQCTYQQSGRSITNYNAYYWKINSATASIVKAIKYKSSPAMTGSNSTTIFLDADGKLWISGLDIGLTATNVVFKCLSTNNSTLMNKRITELDSYGQYVFVTDEDNNLYVWSAYGNDRATVNPTLFDKDEAVELLYGVVNNETRKQFYKESSIVYKNGKYYELSSNGVTEVERDYSKHYIGGIGKITEIVGEYEFKTELGTIYRLIPTGVDTYSIEETTTVTDFSTATPDEPVQIDGVTIKKQVKHKALDNKGNLYVWDTNTGLDKEVTGYVNLTDEHFSVDPVYNQGDGWVVIKGSN